MKTVHIVGGGPSGIATAVNAKKHGYNVILYEKHDLLGGSWIEPFNTRNLHAPRVLFKEASPNFLALLKDLHLDYNKYFKSYSQINTYQTLFKSLALFDYFVLLQSILSNKYTSVADNFKTMSNTGKSFFKALSYIIDGVSWNKMTLYELLNAFIKTGLSSSQHQRVSGYIFCRDMENAVRNLGITIEKQSKLVYINKDDSYLKFISNTVKYDSDNIVVLCVDPGALAKLLNNYSIKLPLKMVYSSICILYYIDYEIDLPSEIDICMNTNWNVICSKLYNENIISCVLCNVESVSSNTNTSVIKTEPLVLIKEVWRQVKSVTKLKTYTSSKICWGAKWNKKYNMWHLEQSSAAYSKDLIDFKIDEHLYSCTMINKRVTPYASIEAACEVANTFSNEYFGKTKVYRSFNAYHLMLILALLFLIFRLKDGLPIHSKNATIYS